MLKSSMHKQNIRSKQHNKVSQCWLNVCFESEGLN